MILEYKNNNMSINQLIIYLSCNQMICHDDDDDGDVQENNTIPCNKDNFFRQQGHVRLQTLQIDSIS